MSSFLRISSVYSNFLKEFNRTYYDYSDDYQTSLNKLFSCNYSISNNLTKSLSRLNYECIEIVENANLIQKKWLKEYGNKDSKETILIQQIKYYKPDFIYIGNADLVDHNFIENIKKNSNVKKIFCFNCAPLTKKIMQNLKNVDGIITCTQGYKQKISNHLKKKVLLMRHSFDKNYQLQNENKYRNIDITFIGSLFLNEGLHAKRVSLIYRLMKNFKNTYIAINFSNYFFLYFSFNILKSIFLFKIHKDIFFYYKLLYVYIFSKKAIFGNKMMNILKSSKILVNTHIDDTEYAGNMRLFEGTGMGCLVLTDFKKDLDKIFQIKKEIEIFTSDNDLVEKCKYFLKNEKELSNISKNGNLRTLTDHTYEQRVLLLDKFIKD